jgi:hypothetical protein
MLSVRRDAVKVVSSGARDYKALDSMDIEYSQNVIVMTFQGLEIQFRK